MGQESENGLQSVEQTGCSNGCFADYVEKCVFSRLWHGRENVNLRPIRDEHLSMSLDHRSDKAQPAPALALSSLPAIV